GPRSILTKGFTDALGDTKGSLFNVLRSNDAVYGWSPSSGTKIHFIHNQFDDLVPYDNTSVAYEEWKKFSNVDTETLWLWIPGLGSVHAGALVPALFSGFLWLHD
ncbi:MAG TPA: hypothetical protein VF799_00175, partial [Geobacteraceae bacterium]